MQILGGRARGARGRAGNAARVRVCALSLALDCSRCGCSGGCGARALSPFGACARSRAPLPLPCPRFRALAPCAPPSCSLMPPKRPPASPRARSPNNSILAQRSCVPLARPCYAMARFAMRSATRSAPQKVIAPCVRMQRASFAACRSKALLIVRPTCAALSRLYAFALRARLRGGALTRTKKPQRLTPLRSFG